MTVFRERILRPNLRFLARPSRDHFRFLGSKSLSREEAEGCEGSIHVRRGRGNWEKSVPSLSAKERPNGRRWAVVVNDVAAINIDGTVVVANEVDTRAGRAVVELGDGCVCCSSKDELAEAIYQLRWTGPMRTFWSRPPASPSRGPSLWESTGGQRHRRRGLQIRRRTQSPGRPRRLRRSRERRARALPGRPPSQATRSPGTRAVLNFRGLSRSFGGPSRPTPTPRPCDQEAGKTEKTAKPGLPRPPLRAGFLRTVIPPRFPTSGGGPPTRPFLPQAGADAHAIADRFTLANSLLLTLE